MSKRSSLKSKPFWFLRTVLLLLAGGAGGILIAMSYDWFARLLGQPSVGFYNPHWITLLLGIPALFIAAIVVHELGHLAGGLLVGFRFVMVMIGPVLLRRTGDRLELHLLRGRAVAGGLAAAMPRDDRNLRPRFAMMVAGGPLANLLAFLLCVLLVIALAPVLQRGGYLASQAGFLVNYFALANFILVVLNIIPYHSRGFDSDGRQFLDLVAGRERAERKCLQVAMVAQSRSGRRPREYDPTLLQRLLALRDNHVGAAAEDAVSYLLAYYYHIDRGEVELAGGYVDQLLTSLEGYNAALRSGVLVESTYFLAMYRKDAAAASQLLAQADKRSFVEQHTLLRAEAALALAEDRFEDARRLAGQASVASQQTNDPGGTLAEREWLQDILAATSQ